MLPFRRTIDEWWMMLVVKMTLTHTTSPANQPSTPPPPCCCGTGLHMHAGGCNGGRILIDCSTTGKSLQASAPARLSQRVAEDGLGRLRPGSERFRRRRGMFTYD